MEEIMRDSIITSIIREQEASASLFIERIGWRDEEKDTK